jgi:hypothetical protein
LGTFNDSERARIRAVLVGYAKENGLSVVELYKRVCAAERTPEAVGFSFKTFQRFVAGCEFRRNPAGDSDLMSATVPI